MRISKLLFLLSFVFTTLLQAQTDKSNYALLWEITGNNLEKPSYLFGTMHVRDQRAAEFPDSVLIALEKTKAYAMEIHPDTLVDFYMELFAKTSDENTLKDQLSASAYERLNRAVLKKTGKPIDSLENQDPSFVQYLLMDFDEPEETAKNDQIVDLYLYKQSWLMGNSIYGLEELKDYDNVTDQFFNMFEKDTYQDMDAAEIEKAKNLQYEEMIKIYQSGDLVALDKWVNGQSTDKEFDAAMLDTRNLKMVESLEKLAKAQPTFFAVGTAHLPGKMGMLTLLKNKGYTVRKVQATFTGYAQSFQPKGTGPKWNTTRNESFGYEVQTPSKFYDFNEVDIPDNLDLEIKFQMDMLDMNAFFMMNIGVPGGAENKEMSLEDLEDILKNQSGDEERKLVSKKMIEHQGIKGGEFKYEEEDNNFSIWRIFMRDHAIHMFVVFREFDDFSSPNITKFYDSIQFFDPAKVASTIQKYESSMGGYTVEMLSNAKYRRVDKSVDPQTPTSIIHQYVATNTETGFYYLMQHNLIAAGSTVQNEQVLLENSFKNMATKWNQPDKKGKPIVVNGLKGLSGGFDIGKENVELQVFIRGNRMYLLIIGCPKDQDLAAPAGQFFNSFKILPYQHTDLATYKLSMVEAKVSFPADATVYETLNPDEDGEYPIVDEWAFTAMDSLSGYNYAVNAYDFPIYYEVGDKEAYYESYKEGLREVVGVSAIVDTTFKGQKAWYLTYESDLHQGFTHSLVFLEGFRIFEANLYAPTGKDDEKAWAFFNSFEPTVKYGAEYIFSDRSEALLASLQSRDTAVQLMAKAGIDRYELSTENLPTIYQMLEKDYPFETLKGASIHELMFQELLYTNDQTTLPFLEKLYAKKAKSVNTQVSILETLATLKTKAAYDLYFKLIANFEQKEFDGYSYNQMISPLRDTLAMTANYYPQIMALRNNEALRYYAYNLVFNFLQNDIITPQKIAKNRVFFLADAQAIVDKYDLSTIKDTMPYIDEFYHLDALNIILGELPVEEKTQAYLTAMLKLPHGKLVSTVIDGLLLQGQAIPKFAFETVFAEPYHWKQLLDNLEFEKNLDKIPADLLTPEATAKAYVYRALEGEYNDLTSYTVLEKRMYEGEGNKVNLYLFTFTITGYEKTYMGVVSQPIEEGEIAVNPSYFDYSTSAYTKEVQEELYETMLAGWKE